ncbi:MAG: hypothetical protein ACFB0C_07245 [Leptolyngbyaceae cyanobacterium]
MKRSPLGVERYNPWQYDLGGRDNTDPALHRLLTARLAFIRVGFKLKYGSDSLDSGRAETLLGHAP